MRGATHVPRVGLSHVLKALGEHLLQELHLVLLPLLVHLVVPSTSLHHQFVTTNTANKAASAACSQLHSDLNF